MITLSPLADPLTLSADFMPATQETQSRYAWSSGTSTLTHMNCWPTVAESLTSNHVPSDLLMGGTTSSFSPFLHQPQADSSFHTDNFSVSGMTSKSAWGTNWFSPDPRLDPSSSGIGTGASGSASSACIHEGQEAQTWSTEDDTQEL
ncbi:hypothetical protein H1R20_g15335, partial [Candolleomyces eurysporus]